MFEDKDDPDDKEFLEGAVGSAEESQIDIMCGSETDDSDDCDSDDSSTKESLPKKHKIMVVNI